MKHQVGDYITLFVGKSQMSPCIFKVEGTRDVRHKVRRLCKKGFPLGDVDFVILQNPKSPSFSACVECKSSLEYMDYLIEKEMEE